MGEKRKKDLRAITGTSPCAPNPAAAGETLSSAGTLGSHSRVPTAAPTQLPAPGTARESPGRAQHTLNSQGEPPNSSTGQSQQLRLEFPKAKQEWFGFPCPRPQPRPVPSSFLTLKVHANAASRAWPRSASKSSSSSSPTERRIRVSLIPRVFLSSSGTEAWVIRAGCSARLS